MTSALIAALLVVAALSAAAYKTCTALESAADNAEKSIPVWQAALLPLPMMLAMAYVLTKFL